MIGHWNDWIGREEKRGDKVDEGLFSQWLATLARKAPVDATVPQGFYRSLCTPDAATAKSCEDGHPFRDEGPTSFLPPIPLPQHM